VTSYAISEGVIIIPGIGNWGKYWLSFPAHFQDTERGIKSRADASAGVVVWAEYMVVERPGGKGWDLVEEVRVECAKMLMPFVKNSMEGAHKNICRDLCKKIEDAEREKNPQEYAKRLEEAKSAEEAQRIEAARRAEKVQRAEGGMRMADAQRTEEARRAADPRPIELEDAQITELDSTQRTELA